MHCATNPKRRKEFVRLLDRDLLVGAIAAPEATEAEVLVDRELADDAVALGNVADT